jgi:phage shock protein A
VNIEVDVLGKYAESALAGILPRMEALESKVKELETELNQYKQSKNS